MKVKDKNINKIEKDTNINDTEKDTNINDIEKDEIINKPEKESNLEEREKNANEFLNNFFLHYHQRKNILFENLKNIYSLISYLSDNMEPLELEDIDFREGREANLEEKINLIENFYREIGINFNFNKIIEEGTFEIIRTNPLDDILDFELTSGQNSYHGNHKSIEVYNNGLLTDSIIWVHEISHYRNQTDNGRGKVNDILTELLAFTESFIYVDYLEKHGYKKEAIMFKISEYKNLYNVIKVAYDLVRIYLLYFLLGEISKENYKYLYKEDDSYEKALTIFENNKNQEKNIIFTILWYSIGAISIYNYERYKEDNSYIEKIKELNDKIQTNTTLEDALKIIDISLNENSLKTIGKLINLFNKDLIEKQSNYVRKS